MPKPTEEVERLLELAEAVIASGKRGDDSSQTVVSTEALAQLEDWIVNRFGDD